MFGACSVALSLCVADNSMMNSGVAHGHGPKYNSMMPENV